MEPWIVVLFALLVAGATVYRWIRTERRRTAMAGAAKQMGLRFAARDPFDLVHLPFEAFARGDGSGVENVMWGSYRGAEVRVFDAWFYTETRDANHRASRNYRYLTCTLAAIDADCPALRIVPEGAFGWVIDRLSRETIDFESEEFNRTFDVRCRDQRFAYALVDARMIEWLLSTGGQFRFEVLGHLVLVVADGRLPVDELPKLLWWQHGFVGHVPRVVRSLYPVSAPARETS